MNIELSEGALDGIAKALLKDMLKTFELNMAATYVHPDDMKMYKKDIKAVKRLLEYLGEEL